MVLTLDIGNTQIHGGLFNNNNLILQFRKTSRLKFSSDEMGLFLKSVLRENDVDPDEIKQVSVCSVVPDALHSIRNCFIKYFETEPFILKAGVKTGLQIKYRNPLEVGTDRIANAIAASHQYPNRNLIIVDFGTATTFDVITNRKEYLGGVIIPGIRISMESLVKATAKLPAVEISEVSEVVGRSTEDSIKSGLYFGQIGMVKELTKRITKEAFGNDKAVLIGTGGFSRLFENSKLFDAISATLVLEGLFLVLKMNMNK